MWSYNLTSPADSSEQMYFHVFPENLLMPYMLPLTGLYCANIPLASFTFIDLADAIGSSGMHANLSLYLLFGNIISNLCTVL